jgi:SAM-dependent methyltransferase
MPEGSKEFDYGSQFGTVYHGARRLPAEAQQWISRIRAEKIKPWISAGDRVLEYGVGFGWNLAALECREKVGFDLTPELRNEVEVKGIRFETNEEALATSTYDKVLAHHVLEHVPSPAKCLKRLKNLLTAGGKLLLFVPFEREREFRTYRATDRAHHLYSWTPASLNRLVTETGWEIEQTRISRFRFDRMAAIAAGKLRSGFGLYRLLRGVGLRLLPEFELCLVARKSELA